MRNEKLGTKSSVCIVSPSLSMSSSSSSLSTLHAAQCALHGIAYATQMYDVQRVSRVSTLHTTHTHCVLLID